MKINQYQPLTKNNLHTANEDKANGFRLEGIWSFESNVFN